MVFGKVPLRVGAFFLYINKTTVLIYTEEASIALLNAPFHLLL
jgi:hypothetical protein